uniref:15-oxoprostaglandin 13-reductase n=1 Tax=Timema bartmani TaxID=61472 RepID=A0A7R9F3U2_9NEOP|nr:unnamed protein product [Timema bartmani]
MVKSKKIVIAKPIVGEPKESDFKIIEEELPPIKNGGAKCSAFALRGPHTGTSLSRACLNHFSTQLSTQVLVEALWLSVDHYQRAVASYVMKPGDTMIGLAVSRIVETRNPKFSVGKLVVGSFGWNTKSVVDVNKPGDLKLPKPYLLPDFKGLPESLGLGLLGMPGKNNEDRRRRRKRTMDEIFWEDVDVEEKRNESETEEHEEIADKEEMGPKYKEVGDALKRIKQGKAPAYFGFLEICKPKPGEVVVVSGAAGAVGSIVGQIAKIKGCKVIGFTGSDDKAKWLVEELGFDAAYNYKTKDIAEALEEAAPEGVDCYFDNVGGSQSIAVIQKMNSFGRISVCGALSYFNSSSAPEVNNTSMKTPSIQLSVLTNQLKMEGFMVGRWNDQWLDGLKQLVQWTTEGKLKYHETVTEGFKNTPKALIQMLKGESLGKAVVKV